MDIRFSKTMNSCKVLQIRYASVGRLLERLTDLRFLSIDFLNTFLHSYRVFTTAVVVLDKLIAIYRKPISAIPARWAGRWAPARGHWWAGEASPGAQPRAGGRRAQSRSVPPPGSKAQLPQPPDEERRGWRERHTGPKPFSVGRIHSNQKRDPWEPWGVSALCRPGHLSPGGP